MTSPFRRRAQHSTAQLRGRSGYTPGPNVTDHAGPASRHPAATGQQPIQAYAHNRRRARLAPSKTRISRTRICPRSLARHVSMVTGMGIVVSSRMGCSCSAMAAGSDTQSTAAGREPFFYFHGRPGSRLEASRPPGGSRGRSPGARSTVRATGCLTSSRAGHHRLAADVAEAAACCR